MNLHELFENENKNPFQDVVDKVAAKEKQSDAEHTQGLKDIENKFQGAEKKSREEFSQKLRVKEASTINGRVQSNDELVWKQTSMGYEQAVEKYGKEHVKLGGKNRRGEETVEVHVPLVAESKERCPQCGMTNCTCSPGKCKCKPVAGWIPNKGFKKVAEQGLAEGQYQSQYKSKEDAIAYAKDKAKTFRDPEDGIEIWSMPDGGFDAVHNMNSNGRNHCVANGGKKLGTIGPRQQDVAEAGRAAPDTDLKIGNRVVADLRKDKDTTIGNQYRSGIVSRVGQKGVHIKPDTRGDQEWHPYNVVKKIGMEEDMANRAESKAQRIAAFEQKAQQGDPAAIRYMEAMKAYDNRMNMARESTEVDEKVSDFLPTAHDNGKLVRGWRKDRGFTE